MRLQEAGPQAQYDRSEQRLRILDQLEQHAVVEGLLAAEMIIDRRAVDLGFARQLAHRNAVEATVGK